MNLLGDLGPSAKPLFMLLYFLITPNRVVYASKAPKVVSLGVHGMPNRVHMRFSTEADAEKALITMGAGHKIQPKLLPINEDAKVTTPKQRAESMADSMSEDSATKYFGYVFS